MIPFNCTTSDSVEILIEDCLSLLKIEKNQTNIYLNPASNSITITSGNSVESNLFIFDNLGILIEGFEIKGNTHTIEVNHLKSVIYTLLLVEKNGLSQHFNLIIEGGMTLKEDGGF